MRPLHIRRLPPEDGRLFLLIREEGIVAEIGDFERPAVLDSAAFSAAAQLRKAARTLPEDRWAGFQPRSSFTASEPVNAIGNIYGQGIVAALGTILGTRPESENCAWGYTKSSPLAGRSISAAHRSAGRHANLSVHAHAGRDGDAGGQRSR